MRAGLCFASILAASAPAAAGPLDPLRLTHSPADVLLEWTPDPAASRYELRRVADKTLLATIVGEPVHLAVPAAPLAFPVADPGALAAPPALHFYDVAAAYGCRPGDDSDGDRLEDCFETGTGIFNGSTDAGTDPLDADTDGDGLEDGDEALGTTTGLDLPGLGASPVRMDLFIEYDWFDDNLGCGNHSHRPTQAIVDRVSAAFAAAPFTNPDTTAGIVVHHDFGQGAPFAGGNLIPDADGVLASGVNSAEYRALKTAHFAVERNGYFYYVILPHRYNTSSSSSGQAEINGDDMIVSLYCSASTVNVANTIVHEWGHNFGLLHGGFEGCNYKPNYNSVMNYKYQFAGADDDCTPGGNGVLDYSRGARIDLDETALDENLGTCGAPSFDWNGDATISAPVAWDLNRTGASQSSPVSNGGCVADMTVLRDHDDWTALSFAGLADADLRARGSEPEVIDCNPDPPGPRE